MQSITTTPDVIARATWAFITEPNDGTVGAFIAAHGAEGALDILQSSKSSSDSDELTALRDKAIPRLSGNRVDEILLAGQQIGATLITPASEHWPSRLNDLGHNAPHNLWVRGDPELLTQTDQIALVGARAATGYGEHVTMELAAGLVDRGYTITSGAAYGIDGMAHRSALASGGNTVAYLAGGLDRFYPSGHDALLSRIVEAGAVVSEAPPTTAPTKWRFLARNRLIASAARSTVVVEAGWRSGSLNTAGHALTLGRPVGAIPGPTTSAASAGCHRLIRDHGATLVTTVNDIVEL